MPAYAITVSQMRAWEQQTWDGGQSEMAVIEKVGEAVAATALQLTRCGDSILVLAGKGNNGKDALAACPHLNDRRVETLLIVNPATSLAPLREKLGAGPALIIDGLFGIGLTRPLSPDWTAIINAINASMCGVMSVDLPSGLNADTGGHEGGCVQARVTLTVGAPKVGLLMAGAAGFVGRLQVAHDVGLSPAPPRSEIEWILPVDFENFPPHRPTDSHKGSFGHLAIIAGSKGFHGAAVLCARGAQRARPGLITLTTLESVYVPVASQLQAVMVSTWNQQDFDSRQSDALLIGPGLAGREVPEDLKQYARQAWRSSDLPMIVDASALGWLERGDAETDAIRVLTPHPGEAARMLGTTAEDVQANRFESLRRLSAAFGNCWVVLKGHQTLVGRSKGSIQVNSSGNPNLAQGGSGDVLAGYLAGLLAQPVLASDPRKTLAYAVWQHGRTADVLKEARGCWTIEELAASLGATDPAQL